MRRLRQKSVADVLAMTVGAAAEFFIEERQVFHALFVLQEMELGYMRLGQAATQLSGGEAQRIKLATELQRMQRGETLCVLNEPTTGLHPSDVDPLIKQLDKLITGGNSVIVIEEDMHVAALSDWVIDVGPGRGWRTSGGRRVAGKDRACKGDQDCSLSLGSIKRRRDLAKRQLTIRAASGRDPEAMAIAVIVGNEKLGLTVVPVFEF